MRVTRRRKSVLLGAGNQDAAQELAQRAAGRAPAAGVHVERTIVWAPPLADFGGMFFA